MFFRSKCEINYTEKYVQEKNLLISNLPSERDVAKENVRFNTANYSTSHNNLY